MMKLKYSLRVSRQSTALMFAMLGYFLGFAAANGATGPDPGAIRTASYIKLTTVDPGESWNEGSLGKAPSPRAGQSAVWTGSEMIIWGGFFYDGTNSYYYSDGARYNAAANNWAPVNGTGAPTMRDSHTAVWTGKEMIVWGGFDGNNILGDGWRYDPASDTWTPMATDDAPLPRLKHTAVWTGTEMIVWGGEGLLGDFADGGRYDPAADKWQAISVNGAPAQRYNHTAVWTGTEMIVWGGYYYLIGDHFLNDGGRYNPVLDQWTPVATAGAPTRRQYHASVWTGSEMIVWGGYYNDGRDQDATDGGRYNPLTDTWTATATTGAPSARTHFSATWTGKRMLIWCGDTDFGPANDGATYDPASDSWLPISTARAPLARGWATTVWTGTEMLVWGGSASGNPDRYFNDGGRYNPQTDSWKSVSAGGPAGRYQNTAVWTGSEMIVWGGFSYYDSAGHYFNDGSSYNPAADSWAPVSTLGAPSPRDQQSAIWTGTEMIVWGGYFSDGVDHFLRDGARYNPVSDSWAPVSMSGAPSARTSHAAVWTGKEMIVWGGFFYDTKSRNLNDGGIYDPTTDSWIPTSTSGAPVGRVGAAVVWSGRDMVVWGGSGDSGDINDGGRYSPALDEWQSISSSGAPATRHSQSAVWTGSEMLVWGGVSGLEDLNDGGRYDPSADRWKPISTNGAPSPRFGHSAVWTGSEMIVWGGDFFDDNDNYRSDGGRYRPASGDWTPVSMVGQPPGRYYHSTVWTGTEMLVWGGYGDTGYLDDTWIYRPKSPKVRLTPLGADSMLVAWPYPSSGFNLEQNSSLTGSGWNGAPETAVPIGSEWQLTVPVNSGDRFFRLLKP